MSQFTSTLLLIDIHSAPILGTQQAAKIAVNFNYTQMENLDWSQSFDLWAQQPLSFPTFAEYWEPGSQTEELYDTGQIYRTLLPFQNSETRSALATYYGNATIYDARAVCVRPEMQMKLRKPIVTSTGDLYPNLYLDGTIRLPQSQYIGPATDSSFTCMAPLPYSPEETIIGTARNDFVDSSEWRVAICVLKFPYLMANSKLESEFDGLDALIIVNVTGTYEQWDRATRDVDGWGDVVYADEEWTTYFDSASRTGINFTLCLPMNATTFGQTISANGGVNHTEPSLGYDSSLSNYQTDEVLTSLGVGGQEVQKLSPQSRGQLALKQPTWENDNTWPIMIDWGNLTCYFMCSHCYYDRGDFGVDGTESHSNLTVKQSTPVVAAVFNSALRTTGRPAQALQALITVFMMTAYSTFLPLYDVFTPVTYQVYSSGLAPTRMIGLTAVLAMIAVHLTLVAACVILFAYRGRTSLVGNSWTAVAQVNEIEEAREWLLRAGRLTDKEIEKQMRFRGVGRKLVGLPPSFEAEESSLSTSRVGD